MLIRGMRLFAVVTVALASVACLDAPDYSGRSCDPISPCPEGYTCGADRRCRAAGLPEDATPIELDGQPRDLGPIADVDAGFIELPDADAAVEPDLGVDGGDLPPPDGGPPPDAGDPVLARCQDPVEHPSTGWQARHFTLTAANELDDCIGVEDIASEVIDRDYATNGPRQGVTDRFGTRYTARRTLGAGVITLALSHDDGLRVRIDGALMYERWADGVQYDVVVRTPYLAAGPHDITVEHYENVGLSQVRVAAVRGCIGLDSPTGGWTVAYYRVAANNTIDEEECFGVETIAGTPLSQNWAASAPPPVLAAGVTDGFAAVARGRRSIGGMTRFTMSHDDGMRVSISGTRIYDGWTAGPRNNQQVDVYTVGVSEIIAEMHDVVGDASYAVSWTNVCAIQTAPSATSWRARYYPAVSAGDSYALDRSICLGAETISGTQLLLDWMGGAAGPPQALGMVERWGAEYTGPRTFAQQTTLNVLVDDGLRIYSGANLLLDVWRQPQVLNTTTVIPAGTHDLRLEYFEWQGFAQLRLTW